PECDLAAALTPAEPDDHRARAMMLGALRAMLCRLARRRPVIIRIDDIHWADRDSLELLRSVLLAGVPARLMFVATLGSDAQGSDHARGLARELEADGKCHRMTLAPLSTAEQRELMQLLAFRRGWAGALDERLW